MSVCVRLCVSVLLCIAGGHTLLYLNGIGGYLDLMELPHSPISVYEVGGGQLVQGFHILS